MKRGSSSGGSTDQPSPGVFVVNRRDFLRLGACSFAAIYLGTGCGSSSDRSPVKRTFTASGRPTPDGGAGAGTVVLWVEAGTCTGCACALLGSFAPPAEELLPGVRLEFQETLMDPAGSNAIDHLLAVAEAHAGRYLLVVDGAIPVGENARMTVLGVDGQGQEYSAESLIRALAVKAAQRVALGTCACYGGIPGSGPWQGSQVSLAEVTGHTPLRVPGCPANPLWITGVLTAALAGKELELDAQGRPVAYFGTTVHDLCPRLEKYDAEDFAEAPGDPVRCLRRVGCRGPFTRGNCPEALWQGRSYCIKAGHPCIGCTSPGFLDGREQVDGQPVRNEGKACSPFYEV